MLKIFTIFILLSAAIVAQTPRRTIAVTIDDLPVVNTRSDIETRRDITKRLLGHVTKAKVPAVGEYLHASAVRRFICFVEILKNRGNERLGEMKEDFVSFHGYFGSRYRRGTRLVWEMAASESSPAL